MVYKIVLPLRKIGVPTAAVYDFDVLKEKTISAEYKTFWRAILSSSNVEYSKFERLEKERQDIESEIRALNVINKKNEEKGYFKELLPSEIPEELYKKICNILNELKECY